ncbi:MAG TPA: phosphotransferase [Alphaproteobacteria bacterium]|nr:phosphotransferase [Alphaproteobacteria bacterium]
MPDSGHTPTAHTPTETMLIAWIEQNIGKVVRIEPQARWRAAWIVDAERDGKTIPLFVKGPREVQAPVPVKLEGAALDVLNKNGIKTPRQYGYCVEIDAIVMERLTGESRLEDIKDIAVRDRVADEYVQAMVKFHALDPQLFIDIGFPAPADPSQLRLAQFLAIEQTYLAKKRMPEAANEFLRLWVHRNVPKGEIKPCFITGDSFQMMYHEGHLNAVMDLEMACIGDPLLDLCCIRMRDLSEKTGTAAVLTRRYEELSGKPIDYKALRFHLVAFSAVSSLLISDAMSAPPAETDYFEYFVYYHGSLRIALEGLAEFMDVTLPPLAVPEPVTTAESIHLRMLGLAIDQIPAAGDMDKYLRSKAAAEATYLSRVNQYGATFDAAYLDDVEKLLGTRPAGTLEAEAKLEAFAQKAGPEHDEALLRLFHMRELQLCFMADIPQNKRLQRFLMEPIATLD